jgi:hypothetical protein
LSGRKEASSSFLKKRTKKLLPVADCTALAFLNRMRDEMSKGFLLLFFKKEVLPFHVL